MTSDRSDRVTGDVPGHVSVPAVLPALASGSHRGPSHGVCVMEYVSLLAGLRFTDRPTCTHPALAALAHAVNDALSEDARVGLLTRVRALAAAGPGRPGVAGAVATAALADREHLRLDPLTDCWTRHRLARLCARDQQPGRGRLARFRDTYLALGLLRIGLERFQTRTYGPRRERALLALLDDALTRIPAPPSDGESAAHRTTRTSVSAPTVTVEGAAWAPPAGCSPR